MDLMNTIFGCNANPFLTLLGIAVIVTIAGLIELGLITLYEYVSGFISEYLKQYFEERKARKARKIHKCKCKKG